MNEQENNLFLGLRCISCRNPYPSDTHTVCGKCGAILTGEYRLEEPISLEKGGSMWQFRQYLPPLEGSNIVSMGEGWTPLISADNYARKTGLGSLICKMEGQNPSGSFKDRPASLSVSLAKQWSKKGIFVASSGNAAAATASYSARGGLPCLVLFRDDSTLSKLGQISMYGTRLLRVKDLFKDEETLDRAFELTQRALPSWLNGFVWAKRNPLIVDALKTITYEIVANGVEPDVVFVPTAGGDLLFGLYKGFLELKALGQLDKLPRMAAVQGVGSSPTVKAIDGVELEAGVSDFQPTIAGALRSSMVSDHAVFAVKGSGGFGVEVTNDQIIEAHRLVAKLDGIFCEASSAAAFAAVSKALSDGRIEKDEIACTIVSGSGFKDYYAPFADISEVPHAESAESIPVALAGSE